MAIGGSLRSGRGHPWPGVRGLSGAALRGVETEFSKNQVASKASYPDVGCGVGWRWAPRRTTPCHSLPSEPVGAFGGPRLLSNLGYTVRRDFGAGRLCALVCRVLG